MPKNKFQEVIFTIMMVFVMVYAMICYNISLNMGGMSNEVFLAAFHELIIMGPIAFILDFFLVMKMLKIHTDMDSGRICVVRGLRAVHMVVR